ncbi:hypothetical protein O7602_21250 [Micromonospora sp. WMMD1128]|uniref:hypothetical protein n=1 Tax=Micromonospora sp. WMMD1128 TaxID=3015150 RepID=UPI00248C521D|nr:hypothetical protein [Micromonospora sp. WMMD1128]WBB72229.1 hypothetical protein O7602_21250 [Micromonospora sp. WMMD1128]
MTSSPNPTPPAEPHRARVDLPDWMRNPEPARRTPGRRLSDLVDGVPALAAVRQRFWAWQGRSRFSERHPAASAILSFVFVAVTATLLVGGASYLFWRITHPGVR